MAELANLLLTNTSRPTNSSNIEYDTKLRNVAGELRKATSIRSAKRITDVELLRVLHPSANTLGYTFLLLHLAIDRSNDIYLISLMTYLTQFDPVQARYVGPEFRKILELTDEIIIATQSTQLLEPLRNAILRLDPDSSTFTSNHHRFVHLCLEARRPRLALPILDKDILDFPYSETLGVDAKLPCGQHDRSSTYITKQSGLSSDTTVLQVQEYYLMGAYVYIGVRNYERARLFLELVLSTPTLNHAANLFMVEAYKKIVLVGLVSKGYPSSTSTLADQGSMRLIQSVSKHYDALTEAFKNRDLAKFHAEVDTAGTVWNDDGNLGLVQEAAESLRRHRVIDLQRTYAALPVDQVAIHLSMSTSTTVQLLQNMIQQGHLQASISSHGAASTTQNGASSSTPVLRFHSWDSSRPVQHPAQGDADNYIHAQIKRIEVLSAAVNEADRKLSVTKEYAEWLRSHRKRADAGAAAFEDPMEMDPSGDMPGGFGDDEDIMAT